MKIFLTALLSFLTLIGGHFVNRRWDRAVLFLALSLTFIFISYLALMMGVTSSEPQDYFNAYGTALDVLAVGMFVILGLSAFVTVYDKRNEHALSQAKFTLSGKVGASLLSFFSAAILILFTFSYISFTKLTSNINLAEGGSISSSEEGSWYSKHFYSALSFGEGRYLSNPKTMLDGEGYFVGSLTHAGKPAVGVSLKLQFNDEYESKELLTDKDGQFVLRLPVGEWDLTRLQANTWTEKPKGDFLLVSGYEPKFEGKPYYSNRPREGSGLHFIVAATMPESENISFKIHPKIVIKNKPKNRKPAEFSIKEDNIEWPSYEGASQYQVQVSRVSKEGKSTFYHPISYRTVKSDTSIAVKDLALTRKKIEGDEKEPIYNITVTAFSEDGSFLSESEGFSAFKFKLKESVVFVDDDSNGFSPIGGMLASAKQRNKYKKRFDAIELLIDEKLYAAAKKLLQADMKGATAGKKEALWGYYYANQKQCKKAKQFFNKASEIGGAKCVISEHEKLCL